MISLIAIGLAATAALAIVYIIGSELCLPAARGALRTGNARMWRAVCFFVSIGECALIAGAATALVLAENTWQLFTGGLPGTLVGFIAAGILVISAIRELSGRIQKKQSAVMSHSLDLVLPAHGSQRKLYARSRHELESSGRTERNRIVRELLREGCMTELR
jgi:hypothetical protein